MNNKKLLGLMILSMGILMLCGCSSAQPTSVNDVTKVMTVEPNIFMSNEAGNPPVNNSIQTITFKFSEPLDSNTISDKVKLYKMDSSGNSIEEPCIVRIDTDIPTLMYINNKKVEKFTEGEEYKIVIGSSIKSTTGLALEKDFTGYFATNYTLNLSGVAELNNTKSQIVVISDLHLGINDDFAELNDNRQALVDFLNQIKNSPNVKELVIAGDLFDEWFLPMEYVMPQSQSTFFDSVASNNQTVVDAFNAIISAGDIKVTYVPGNHDLLMTEADMMRIFPGINQARDKVQGLGSYITGANSEIVIEHGHKYNFFCAPDQISNRDITKNNSSILPPGYFFTRIATSSVIEGHPSSSNIFPDVTANPNDESQYQYFLYQQVWKSMMTTLPVKENQKDKVIKTNIDGYTLDYAINDLIPYQNSKNGIIDVNLYKGIQDTWEERQNLNGVKVKIQTNEAIIKASDIGFTDIQSKNQFFDCDASKRIVVFGHTHAARILPFSNLKDKKTIYANSGTWIDDAQGYPTRTFLVITPAKSGSAVQFVNLYQYSSDKTITQWEEAQAITN
ncbi:MAG: metallophosphoesterase [Lutisporaceae bacterium]